MRSSFFVRTKQRVCVKASERASSLSLCLFLSRAHAQKNEEDLSRSRSSCRIFLEPSLRLCESNVPPQEKEDTHSLRERTKKKKKKKCEDEKKPWRQARLHSSRPSFISANRILPSSGILLSASFGTIWRSMYCKHYVSKCTRCMKLVATSHQNLSKSS